MDSRTAHAMIRFGLGRRLGEPVPADPIAWLLGQLDATDPMLAVQAPSVAEGLNLLALDRNDSRMMGAEPIRRVGAMFFAETQAITHNLLNTTTPFRERLVWFWANHFTVSLRFGGEIQATLASYVREAIRPHVTGRFVDMLSAVMRHPAMLMYLDNAISTGPNSYLGKRLNRGINENLARESLELHTVTPAAGYTQTDIIEYARVLTGRGLEIGGRLSGFHFREDAHEPGPKTVMGQTIPPGLAGGEAMFAFLATHPATYRHLALKLARHFIADEPPDSAVRRIATTLRDTKGDLGAASRLLVTMPDTWEPLRKIRTPVEYVFAVLRAVGLSTYSPNELGAVLGVLNEPYFGALFPNGYPDIAAQWTSGEDMMRRVDWVYRLMPYFTAINPGDLADDILGDLISRETATQVRRAGSRRDALTLLLSSPEFQRR